MAVAAGGRHQRQGIGRGRTWTGAARLRALGGPLHLAAPGAPARADRGRRREIADGALERAVLRVRDAAEALVRAGRIPAHPTHFEAVTAAAFLHFAARRVDVAVLEVGLGGRLDATNVCDPVASAIVTIARDHEALARRGGCAAIAREKAGVLRRGRTCVLGALPPSARRAIGAAARRAGAHLRDAVPEGSALETERRPHRAHGGARLPRPAAAARRAPDREPVRRAGAARGGGRRPASACAGPACRAPSRARAGRDGCRRLPGRPQVLLDGAHNPEGARALARHLAGGPPFVLVFGAMADKDVGAMAALAVPAGRARGADERRPGPRRVPAGARADGRHARARGGAGGHAFRGAWPARGALAGPRGRVVVAGSLFLVGDVLALSRRRASAARRRRRSRRAGS